MRAVAFTLLLLACGSSWAATVYKWVDEQGVTHYSDQPHPGAVKVHVGEAQSYSSAEARAQGGAEEAAPPAAGPSAQCAIDSPGNEETLMNAHSLTGHLSISPAPPGASQILIVLDGKPFPNAADASGGFTISPIDRGAHSLAAQVLGPGGQVLCQTAPVTFYVHQPSTQAPNPASRPKF
jgi:hypothetical protein